MEQIEKVISLLKKAHEKVVLRKDITVYGYQFNYQYDFIGGVSKYLFSNLEIEEFLAETVENGGYGNRPGQIKESTEFIVVHDTASTAETAGAKAHANYVHNGGGGTSWHYSSGSDALVHQIPDNEVAYHAGDGLVVPYELHWTGVKAEYDNPVVTMKNGYYYINNKKSLIKIPNISVVQEKDDVFIESDGVRQGRKFKKSDLAMLNSFELNDSHINDYGLHLVIKDGYYYIGNTYYNPSYNKIANKGGNLRSIGIEMMINKGSNLSFTYHNTAKLIAKLLVENHLDLDRVKAHHFFSGKNCPCTLRENGLWTYFLQMVEIEYEMLKCANEVDIQFVCDSEFVNEKGLITNIPEELKSISYKVIVKHNEQVRELDFVTIVK